MAYFFYNSDGGQSHALIRKGVAVTGGPRKFGKQLGQLRPRDTLLMYENGTGIVAIGRVQEEWDRKWNRDDVWYYPDDPHEFRIRVRWFRDLTKKPIDIARIKEVVGYQPRGAVRRIVKRVADIEELLREYLPKNTTSKEVEFLEGEKRAVTGSARNPQLREAAKRRWGLKCYCCGFDFEAFYGGVARGLAIVHHLQTFEGTSGKRREATVRDVRVVCANCHQVIHVEKQPIDVEHLMGQVAESWTSWSADGIRRKG